MSARANPARHTRTRSLLVTVLALAALALLAAAPGACAQGSAWWHLDSTVAPSHLPRHGEAQIVLSATNLGDGEVDATHSDVVLSDTLPPGITPVAIAEANGAGGGAALNCSLAQTVVCTFAGKLAPYESLSARIVVNVDEPTVAPLHNLLTVSGGETPSPPPLEKPFTLDEPGSPQASTPFGLESYSLTPEAKDGSTDTQAGSHPFQLTTALDLNQSLAEYRTGLEEGFFPSAPALPRDLHFKLPAGLVADTTAMPRCSQSDFLTLRAGVSNLCPPDTAIGVVSVLLNLPTEGFFHPTVPLFNLTPSPGEPARFGFVAEEVAVVLDASLPAGGEYDAEVTASETTQGGQVLSSLVSIWGTPGDPAHDSSRGWECLRGGLLVRQYHLPCVPEDQRQPTAFLTLPTSCERPPVSSVSGDSWPTGEPGNEGSLLASENATYSFPTALTGCGLLGFDPSLSLEPESRSGSTPTALNATVSMPQPGLTAPEGDAESAIRETTVTLPAGLQLSPAAATGLEACSALDFGSPFEGASEERQSSNEAFSPGPPDCPDAAKVGTVAIQTPLLKSEVKGSLYLAAQNTSPFRSPLALYLTAEDPADGILVKLAGTVRVNEQTGQLTTTFANTPQLPFTHLKLHFFGGQRASLSTPPLCGSYAAATSFTGWSGALATPASTPPFSISSGPGGGACPPSPLPFAPGFQAGSSSTQAGGFTPFTVTIANPDGDQALTGVTVHMPPGVAGILAGVTPCPEPPAGVEWSCGPASLIGHSVASAGLGTEPFNLDGRVFLTAGYDGAPFGLLVSTPAVAGPFNLGVVNVRSRIDVNPETAAVTITTDPGPHGDGLPTRLDGVPAQIKQIVVDVDRAGFTFNPTDCEPLPLTGSLAGAEGALAPVSSFFQATNCAPLPFHPTLEASTSGRASRPNGASLTVKVTSRGLGVANIKKVDLQLPIQLPSRLSTIQKACVDSVFASTATPGAACDEGSVIGSATIHTPVLKTRCRGRRTWSPMAAPRSRMSSSCCTAKVSLIVLDGKTDIEKGITYSRFESAPDAPFTTFETVLPEGPHSALGAYIKGSTRMTSAGRSS